MTLDLPVDVEDERPKAKESGSGGGGAAPRRRLRAAPRGGGHRTGHLHLATSSPRRSVHQEESDIHFRMRFVIAKFRQEIMYH